VFKVFYPGRRCMIPGIPDLVIDWIQTCAVWMPQGRQNSLVFLRAEGQWIHLHDALSSFHKVVQQHNLGDVANSIPHLCAGTW